MADKGLVQAYLNQLDSDTKKALLPLFEYLLVSLRAGAADHQTRSGNFQWYGFQSTTASVAGTEFSIQHGLGQIPTTLIPVMRLDSVGERIVPLTVTRAADANRVYLSSSSTSAPFRCFLEV